MQFIAAGNFYANRMSLKYNDLIKDTKRITVMENHWKGDRGVGIAGVSGRTLENMEDEKYIYIRRFWRQRNMC